MSDEHRGPVPQDDHVRNVSLPARLYGTKHTHRLAPARLALAVSAAVGPWARGRRNSAERRDAERFMADLLLHTPRAPEAQELARRWMVEKSRMGEMLWRPWLLKGSRILGREHWDAAHRPGRGCLLVGGHIGPGWATSTILCRHGLDHYVVGHPHYWDPMPPGYSGLAKLHRRREYLEKPLGRSRVLLSDGPPERLLELLRGGESLVLAFDVPGAAATPFLGRSVALSGGMATLPLKANAMVLPAVAERHGTRVQLRFLPPIDPDDHRDPRLLRAAIARAFEPVVLACPEAVELAFVPSPLVTETPPPIVVA